MTDVTIFDAASGIIRRRLSISLPAEAVSDFVLPTDALPAFMALNLEPDEAWIEGAFDADTHRIRDGIPTALPARPGPWAVFDAGAWQWLDPRTPADLDAEALAALTAARSAAMALVLDWIAQVSVPLTGGVPLEEMLSWTAKEVAAEAVLAGTATSGQMLMVGAEAALTGETVPALCHIILGKAAAYNGAVGVISGLRRVAEAQLAAVTDPAACEPVALAAIAAASAALGL